MNRRRKQSGMTLVLALTLLSVLVIVVSALTMHLLSSMREAQRETTTAQLFHVAEAGVNHALARLAQDANYRGEKATAFGSGSFDVEIKDADGEKTIRATGHWRNSARELSQTITVRVGAAGIVDWKQSPLSIARSNAP